jgi:hypothetical protein
MVDDEIQMGFIARANSGRLKTLMSSRTSSSSARR